MISHALNIIRLPRSFHVRPAALLLMLLALSLLIAGCNSNQPDPRAFNTPPNDAYALSGGKITHFTPIPGLSSSRTDKAMLEACQQLSIHTNIARSAILVLTAGQFGKSPLHAMVVGKRVLMLPADLITMGMNHGLTFPPFAPSHGIGEITLIPGSKMALVGNKRILLHDPVLEIATKDLVMNWVDMTTLLHERDVQRHEPPFIRNVQIIYDIRDYHP